MSLGGSSSFTTDVSETGFCIELVRVVAPGSAISGTISVKGQDFPFQGRVAWAKAGDMRLNMRGKMGVAFSEIPDEFRRALREEAGLAKP